jgi:sigma-B regulation protein RsbU (phosphoserine phosphatase)
MSNSIVCSISLIVSRMTDVFPSMFQILLIDDDPIIQMVFRKTLAEEGYDVIIASSGEEGLEQAKKFHPALIICDCLMEGMDGLEVCHQIKSDPALTSAFFILLTSRTAIEDRVKGLDTGADDFLTKPIDVSELKARVRAGLRLYQSTQELQQLAQDLHSQKQRLENELAEAADYVKSLLPEPITGSVAINTCFLPSQQLGGDCFDFYWLDPDHLVIYLLDVSGHGVGAALPSISVHNLLRSRSLPNANLYQPHEVLKGLNTLFQMGKHNERYFTIWYGVYNLKNRQLTYASAGHPPAVLLDVATHDPTQSQRLKTIGLPIGMFPDTRYSSQVCDISLGSTLYVFSDGIYEVKQLDGHDWNLNGFIQLLTHCNSPCVSDLEQVVQKIKAMSGNQPFEDDCSILQVRFS